ncbi:hypothetical protein HXX76_006254 [Chlamydomonas incerta]|uniref:Uncharacterized protein n=1 Tax=Chlamydomonas incerta TaxID=51695 RepID=A0A835TF87_CHLIN|nr:hypothetical protein HXX76_006254 [Chlamydomonas incerta]|eukprot:KAG2436730.1 hypothetical protein HXX76_006254 [Chlamydomonas incerta]
MSGQRGPKRAKVAAPDETPAPVVPEPSPGPSPSGVSSFLQSWAWKREHRPDRDRFQRPYVHPLADGRKLTVEQARFSGGEGFASTVWDSSIVVAKYLERHAAALVRGRRLLDLSAGCGLPGLTAASLGAGCVLATDLPPNLPLLRRNAERNGLAGVVRVAEHWWGGDVAPLEAQAGGAIDLVLACDVMYVEEAVPALVSSLAALCGGRYSPPAPPAQEQQQAQQDEQLQSAAGRSERCKDAAHGGEDGGSGGGAGASGDDGRRDPGVSRSGRETVVLLAHGRNRFAEAAFWRQAAAARLEAERVPAAELDPVYQCSDVEVFTLRLRGQRGPSGSGAGSGAGSGGKEVEPEVAPAVEAEPGTAAEESGKGVQQVRGARGNFGREATGGQAKRRANE